MSYKYGTDPDIDKIMNGYLNDKIKEKEAIEFALSAFNAYVFKGSLAYAS